MKTKVKLEHLTDEKGKPFIRLSKKRGAISHREAYEAMESEYKFGPYLIFMQVPEEAPMELYDDEGDYWELYEPGVILDSILDDKVEQAFNEGYEACIKDYKLQQQ